jgi:hypothetical protein
MVALLEGEKRLGWRRRGRPREKFFKAKNKK